ncbi:Phosphodiesterase I [Leptospira biflexa serovar Patoc strain 'Patoc 1 (Ames)']|uniref:Putative metallo-dependent phosphatase n=1 Tax=Leptospira biflexa serovar Patoc (strain Patoc 1 / ATCC 23582 / Paris) TaxID=456481 RepID=B0SN35_LEPBP|nr:alkaline phosphatase D family protein [Leptospira biflexa]ABZ93588.1 Phosphodiesterase I [Leptospira biflexa serovar Patoc strain 'Patoc 1 (Ames)']ABZ97222.1 Putative metallo-dependent phosphatase [Leptospira biflexa serovar Patoc strain 'Patoc 1 (Paris)']
MQMITKSQILFPIFVFLIFISQKPIFAKDSNSLSIGFGSCLHQDKESPILNTILGKKLEYLILLGDIVYADSLIADEKIPAFEKQFNRKEWKSIQKNTQLLFTWDDHDYGLNDSGGEYPDKVKSRNLFLSYVKPRMPKKITFGTKNKEGVFYSYWVLFHGKKIHIVVPDTRYFRSPLQRSFLSYFTGKSHYKPSNETNQNLLGDEQWIWLEEELSKPSDLLVFVSSIQVLPTEQPFEKWNNLPNEREKLIQSLYKANTKDMVILSGDRHLAEIHEYKNMNHPRLVEITSSSFNLPLPWLPLEYDSELKLGKAYKNENFGILQIFWNDGKLHWKSTIHDKEGNSVLEYDPSQETVSNQSKGIE